MQGTAGISVGALVSSQERRALLVPRMNCGSNAHCVPVLVYVEFRLFVLPKNSSRQLLSGVWKETRTDVSWANRHLGVLLHVIVLHFQFKLPIELSAPPPAQICKPLAATFFELKMLWGFCVQKGIASGPATMPAPGALNHLTCLGSSPLRCVGNTPCLSITLAAAPRDVLAATRTTAVTAHGPRAADETTI